MKPGDKVIIGNDAADAGLEGIYLRTAVDEYNQRKVYLRCTAPPDTGDRYGGMVGRTVSYLPKFVEKVIPAEPALKPGDRVRVWDSKYPEDSENGCEGTILFNRPDNGDDFMVLITKKGPNSEFYPRLGSALSYDRHNLERIEPVKKETGLDQHHEAIDTLLPFV